MSASTGENPDRPLKVLVCGDVKGKLNALFSRVKSVQNKAGQFDMLFCVGSFFGVDMAEWEVYKKGEKSVPITTYILGANDDEHAPLFMADEGAELCDNITYLGKKGMFTSTSGLSVVYVSGRDGQNSDDFSHFCTEEILSLAKSVTSTPGYRGVDLLLTSVWPKGVNRYGTDLSHTVNHASASVAQLARAIAPRYHFSGLEGIGYERNPYRNHKVLAGAAKHVSRFIALADVGNKEKNKYIYALSIAPMKYIKQEELTKQPPDVTECPYTDSAAGNSKEPERNSIFYGEGPVNKGTKRQGGTTDVPDAKREPPKPQGPCWFCLGSAEVEKHLVVSVGLHTYMAIAKGALTDLHVLIMPIGHFQSLVTCSDEVLEEIEKYKEALKKFYKSQDQSVVFFERNFKSSHTQLQAVPVPGDRANACLESFMNTASEHKLDLVEIPAHSELKQIIPAGKTYFYAELPTGEKLFCRIQKWFPLQFGREVMVDTSLLDKPHAVDWKQVALGKEDETDVAKKFKKAFKPFDFNVL